MDRLIFHCDCNNFYASCEILERPELRDVPMAVAGDPEHRTGIVVAKNEIAKRAGVKTTDTVWAAQKKCPGIVFVPPRHKYYEQISDKVNEIYHQYMWECSLRNLLFQAHTDPEAVDEFLSVVLPAQVIHSVNDCVYTLYRQTIQQAGQFLVVLLDSLTVSARCFTVHPEQ